MRRALAGVVMTAAALGQVPAIDFTCPMDPDVRAKSPGKCPRCGMPLEARIQQPLTYRLKLQVHGDDLAFELIDPRTNTRATKFETVHEKLFHLFLVSADLSYFVHDHPVPGADGIFRYRANFPAPGIYRLLADCYPAGGTPQLLPAFITTKGYDKSIAASTTHLPPDLTAKTAENLTVSLRMDPPQPLPGHKTMLFFTLEPGDGIEPYLGAWGHLLAADSDLVDTIHDHPIYAKGNEIQFDVFFPREAMYRVWVQFQRRGVVNTAAFNIPVRAPR